MKLKSIVPIRIKKVIREYVNRVKYNKHYKKFLEEKLSLSSTDNERFFMMLVPVYGNLGDHAIAEAEKAFFADKFPEKEYIEISYNDYKYQKNSILKTIKQNDTIFIHGGGFLGNLWIDAEYYVRDILQSFPNNKIIIMPQTLYFDSKIKNAKKELFITKEIYKKHNNLTIFLRERQSFEFAKKIFPDNIKIELVPDIVTYLEERHSESKREYITYVLRNDHEKIDNSSTLGMITSLLKEENFKLKKYDNVLPFNFGEYERDLYLKKQYDNFLSSKLIVTDRLHGMLFALITGTPCIAMNNNSGKVRGVYEWIKEDFDYIKCIDNNMDSKTIKEMVYELINYEPSPYEPSIKLKEQFNKMKILIKENI